MTDSDACKNCGDSMSGAARVRRKRCMNCHGSCCSLCSRTCFACRGPRNTGANCRHCSTCFRLCLDGSDRGLHWLPLSRRQRLWQARWVARREAKQEAELRVRSDFLLAELRRLSAALSWPPVACLQRGCPALVGCLVPCGLPLEVAAVVARYAFGASYYRQHADLDRGFLAFRTAGWLACSTCDAPFEPVHPVWLDGHRSSSLCRERLPDGRPPGSAVRVGPCPVCDVNFRFLARSCGLCGLSLGSEMCCGLLRAVSGRLAEMQRPGDVVSALADLLLLVPQSQRRLALDLAASRTDGLEEPDRPGPARQVAPASY